MPQWRRDAPSPEDLAKKIAERLASSRPAPTRFSIRGSGFVGRLATGAFILISVGAVLVGLIGGADWLVDPTTMDPAEVLDATLTNGDPGGDGLAPLADTTTSRSSQGTFPIPSSSTTTVVAAAGATTSPDPTRVTLPPTTTTSTSVTTTDPSPSTTAPVPSPSTSTPIATSTSLGPTTSTVASPTSTSLPATTTTFPITTTMPATTTTVVSTTTTGAPLTTCGNQGNGQGNC